MKYIDAEKLIVEIERRRDSALERQKNLEKIGQETVLNEMIAFELNRLISFVASLQQEQSTNQSIITKERRINMCTAKKHSQWCRIVNCKDCPHYTKGKK